MSWNIGDNRNLILYSKSNFGLYQVLLTIPKMSPGKLAPAVVEMQQLPDIEKTDSKDEFFCPKWTTYIGRRKVSVNFKTDTDNLNIVVYRYRFNLYLKGNEFDLKLTECQSLLAQQVYLLSCIDIFSSGAL